ncbi:MAG: ATP-binding protein [Weeksellaceae bacterium]|nr:ATP-binding protein [Weeksellaceae bacterium]
MDRYLVFILVSAILLTLITWVVMQQWFSFDITSNVAGLIGLMAGFLIIQFVLIRVAIFVQTRQNISAISKALPELDDRKDGPYSLESLSEEISNLEKDRTQEIDILREKENYRREFVGNVAHELKTPLFSIQGYLLTLIEGGVEDESIRDRYLNRINKSVERLTYIVKDLDLITELETGNLKLDYYPFNLVALCREVLDLLEIKAANHNIKLHLDIPNSSPLRVNADIERIEQVLTNLVANAINHSQRAAQVTISISSESKGVKVSVSDTGKGIPPEHINRIFERFYRVDKSRSREQGGSGLGLSIVKHILEAHGQKIYVDSTVGVGTKFWFYLDKA